MGQRKNMRTLLGILKDKASVAKANLSTTKSSTSFTREAVLRATTHKATAAPAEYRIASVLSIGLGPPRVACTCIEFIMDRLYKTKNAFVALKCLYAIHNILDQGTLVLKEQLTFSPSSGGHVFLKLSKFSDNFDKETSEYSSWVRWYADFVEYNLMFSRTFGYHLCYSSSESKKAKGMRIRKVPCSDLLQEIEVLVKFMEQLVSYPESLHLRKNDLLFQIVGLVCEDYRSIRQELLLRFGELGYRVVSLSDRQLNQLLEALERVEDCKSKLILMFVNRANRDGLWDLITQTKRDVRSVLENRRKPTNPFLLTNVWFPDSVDC